MPIIQDVVNSCDLIKDIHKRKNDDYAGGAIGEVDAFFNFNVQEYVMSLFKNDRDKVFAGMVGLKLARLASLMNQNGPPKNESIEDTFIDMPTYVLIWKADYKRRTEIKPKVNEAELDARVDALNTR